MKIVNRKDIEGYLIEYFYFLWGGYFYGDNIFTGRIIMGRGIFPHFYGEENHYGEGNPSTMGSIFVLWIDYEYVAPRKNF